MGEAERASIPYCQVTASKSRLPSRPRQTATMSTSTHVKLLSRDIQIQATSLQSSVSSDNSGHLTLNVRYHKPPVTDGRTPTVLCLPFWGGSTSTFDSVLTQLALLSSSSISVALTYRGTGSTHARGPDTAQDHSTSSLAADVVRVLSSPDFLDLVSSGRLVLVAHSMSAKIAYHVLYLLASGGIGNGVRIEIERMLLLAPAPIGPLNLPPEMCAQQLRAYDSLESAGWTVRNVLSYAPLDDDMVRRLAGDAVGMSPGAKRGWVEYGMKLDCTEVLKGFMTLMKDRRALKVRVLVGREDKVE